MRPAAGNGNWGINSPDWINELAAENSLTQEYLASVIDAYYGLWEAWTGTSGSMWGIYYPKGRNDIASLDPAAWELIPKFFNPYLTYMAYLSPTLSGTFRLLLLLFCQSTPDAQCRESSLVSACGKYDLNGVQSALCTMLNYCLCV